MAYRDFPIQYHNSILLSVKHTGLVYVKNAGLLLLLLVFFATKKIHNFNNVCHSGFWKFISIKTSAILCTFTYNNRTIFIGNNILKIRLYSVYETLLAPV